MAGAISTIQVEQESVAAGDIFSSGGGGKCPKIRRGSNIFVSHTLETVMNFSDQ